MTEESVKQDLALAYQFLAALGMDDLTYTHLSARVPGSDVFFIYPFGLLFAEVTKDNLLTVTLDGEVIQGSESQYNKTGYVIHSGIYRARPDLNAIFHMHTISGVAVAVMACGLLPISQFSFHFYNRMAYHTYDSLALDLEKQGAKLADDLRSFSAMILRNHGTLTAGATIQEAFFYAYYLEKACQVQCAALQSGQPLVYPTQEVCERAAEDMRAYEPNLGARDWQALKRCFSTRSKNKSHFVHVPKKINEKAI